MILDIAYISFLNCLQMTEIKVVEWNFPWKPIVTFRTSKHVLREIRYQQKALPVIWRLYTIQGKAKESLKITTLKHPSD